MIITNPDATGHGEYDFTKGESNNHPLMAIWLEDIQENTSKPCLSLNPSAKAHSSTPINRKALVAWPGQEAGSPTLLGP